MDKKAEMNHSAPHKALRIFGIVLVILLPVLLALWFAQIRAKAETADQLRLFSRLALQKTEMVIREADEARDKSPLVSGERYVHHSISNICSVLFAACSISTI